MFSAAVVTVCLAAACGDTDHSDDFDTQATAYAGDSSSILPRRATLKSPLRPGATRSTASSETQAGASVDVAQSATVSESVPQTTVSTSTTSSSGQCVARSAPGAIDQTMVTLDNPVTIPATFSGIHLSLDVPEYKPKPYGSAIPLPNYQYGYLRSLKAEVDGLEERGFWANIETSPGQYDWSYMDQWMAATQGHPVIWLIYGTPTFYQKYPGEAARWPSWPGVGSPPTESAHPALTRYAQAVKQRYGNRIAAFEVWNEPTLPWTTGITSYNDRWSPQWRDANSPNNPPFFSGTATDLANIAFTLKNANLGVPILGAGFVDQWRDNQHSVTRFLNAPVTVSGGSGTGKDFIDGLSMHFYDYHHNPKQLLTVINGYKAKLQAAGIPNMPIWGTETGGEHSGAFTANDPRAPVAIKRWSWIAAASRLQSLVLYGHISAPERVGNLGDPVYNPQVAQAIESVSQLHGQTICQAAVLQDGRVWLSTADGTQHVQ